jgi:hypothetical protein
LENTMSSYSVTLTSDHPLPACVYQQVAWVATPTTYKMFAEVEVGIYPEHAFLDVHFKKTIPAFVEQYKQPCDVVKGHRADLIQKYGEDLYMNGHVETAIMYSEQLSKSEKDTLVQRKGGVDQFPTVTGLTQTIYDLTDQITQKENLSEDQLLALQIVRKSVDAHFPGLKTHQE